MNEKSTKWTNAKFDDLINVEDDFHHADDAKPREKSQSSSWLKKENM